MKKSERIKILEEKVEELSNAHHEMEMKLSDAMNRINSLRKDIAILQSEVNYVKE